MLALDDDTFREMARAYPGQVGPIRELRHTLGQMRLEDLAVGPDGRNQCLLSCCRSRTGRNQPSNTAFIFGPSAWLRTLIRPGPGRAVASVDWSQQELGIATALSADPRMMDAYRSGDFYLMFAKMAGAVPRDATKQTHGRDRDRFKTVALGVLYGLLADGLARKLGEPSCRGRELLDLRRLTFRRIWEWSDAIQDRAMLAGELRTVLGWTLRVGSDANPRSLRNFPMQANGAEMMQLAACLAADRGITVCAPVHDAFMVEAAADRIEAEADRMREAMREASELVLPGFPLKTDAKVVRHPDRFTDPRGERVGAAVLGMLDGLAGGTNPGTGATPTQSYVSDPLIEVPGMADGRPVRPRRMDPPPRPPGATARVTAPALAGGKFLKDPIPWRWVEAAAALPGKALAVGLAVWREAVCTRSRTVTVTLARLSRPGWSADTARRAVRALEGSGLVTVERLPGHALRVTLTEPPTPPTNLADG